MWIRRLKLRLPGARDDEGIAMAMVIGISAVLMLLLTFTLSVSMSGVVKAKTDENWNGAIAAAYAGIEDYKSRIADDNTYYRTGNASAAFSVGSDFANTDPDNPAFGSGATGSWSYIENSADGAAYRYEVDNSSYADTGVLKVRSTGRVGNVTRSVVVDLKQKGFIDYLYYTMYEIQDPDISGKTGCVVYAWNGRNADCSDIAFGSSDELYGPVHSNDIMRVCEAKFYGVVTTGWNPGTNQNLLRYKRINSQGQNCTATEVFDKGKPTTAKVLDLPPTNGDMRDEVRTDLPATVARPGCLYTGPTKITFHNDGTMTVWSPWTKKTQIAFSTGANPAPVSGTTPTMCGTVNSNNNIANTLGHVDGQRIPALEKNLIFVQNVPTGTANSAASTNPNFWLSTARPSRFTSSTCSTGNGIGYPRNSEYVTSVSTSYGCTNGDLFVEGTVNAQMTISTENYVYVTGDIKYVNPEANVLGLVGQGAVWVWNPVSRTCTSNSGSSNCNSYSYASLLPDNREINAAMVSVLHTIQVQNADKGGSQGILTVKGAMSQKFRGIVRTNSNGYAKNYRYDERFRFIAPPKFLSPVSTTYGISVMVESKTAYNADGSVIAP
jgi:hypothetical protein